MWPRELADLTELKQFILDSVNYDENRGFTFNQIAIGMSLQEIIAMHGEPTSYDASEEQQTVLYETFVDHPVHGKRDHHKLKTLCWAFREEVLEIVRIHFDYYKTGDSWDAYNEFVKELFNLLIQKLGKPEKKSFRSGREEVAYVRGKNKITIWNNNEGIRIETMRRS